MKGGYVIWPEGQPGRAKFARTWLGKQWLLVGPMGLRAGISLRRMTCFWPAYPDEDHATNAALWEDAIARHHAEGGQ